MKGEYRSIFRDSSTFEVFVFLVRTAPKIGWQHLKTLRKNKYDYNLKFHERTISHTSIIESLWIFKQNKTSFRIFKLLLKSIFFIKFCIIC